MVEAAMHRGHSTAGGGLVDHVVVHQGGGVDHLGDLRQAPVARTELAVGGDRPGDQQHNAGA